MIAGLKRCTYPPIAFLAAVVALTVAILALLPGVAEAQEGQGASTAPATPPAHSRVVAPGDCLWSISQERLGPDATPQQIALDVQRLHEINRNQIGDDPDLIFPGQRLALPPPTGESAAPEAPADRPSGPAAQTPAGAAGGGTPEQAARQAPERAAEPIALPALPEGHAVPEARSLPSGHGALGGGLGIPDDERRRLLGLGIIALTLILAGLIAWRLPMRRDVGDAEAWGQYPTYSSYYGGDRYHHRDTDLLVEDKPRPGPVPVTAPAKGHEAGRTGAAWSPLKGLAVANDPLVRRALRRASRGASTPGRPLPNRPVVVARGPLRRAARSAVMRRHSARRRPAGLARGRNR